MSVYEGEKILSKFSIKFYIKIRGLCFFDSVGVETATQTDVGRDDEKNQLSAGIRRVEAGRNADDKLPGLQDKKRGLWTSRRGRRGSLL